MSENYGHPKIEFSMEPYRKRIHKSTDEIYITQLVPHKVQPFEPYTGKRLVDFVKDIIENGFGKPIIVQPIDTSVDYIKRKYEVLSGYNRLLVAKEAKFVSVPANIIEGLTEEEALEIVNENIPDKIFFKYMKPSERADALAFYYDEIKKSSGYRSDLKEKKENKTSAPMERRSNTQDKTYNQKGSIETPELLIEIGNPTCAPIRRRLDTREIIAQEYSIGKTEVARLLRIHKLITALKNRLDNDEIGMRVAEALSFLKDAEQEMVEEIITSGTKINTKQADKLKEKSKQGEITQAYIMKILEP